MQRHELIPGTVYKVTGGDDAGAVVRFHFVNSSGHADCRFAEPFGTLGVGEIIVVRLENLAEVSNAQA